MHSLNLSAMIAATALTVSPISAAPVSFYIAVDQLALLTSGPYTGLENPNFGRLTLLFEHGDHFHSIGAYSYSGPADAPQVEPTNTNNRIPEISSNEPPLRLGPGSGLYNGKLTNHPGSSEYSDIAFASINELGGFAPGSPEHILQSSSGGRWRSSLHTAEVALELLSITNGLRVGTAANPEILTSPGSLYTLGLGNSFTFRPVFWTESTAPVGTYSVTMRLLDVSGTSAFQPSGEFTFDSAVVPEPSSILLLASGLLAVLAAAHKRR